jgi:hypothetical protein
VNKNMRINDFDLEIVLKDLNALSVNTYQIDGAYGGVKLVMLIKNSSGAISNITDCGYMPKKELYHIISGIVNYLAAEKRTEDKRLKEEDERDSILQDQADMQRDMEGSI